MGNGVLNAYVVYVNANQEILIDYNNQHFKHAYPSTLKGLKEIERGKTTGARELIKIHSRLKKQVAAEK